MEERLKLVEARVTNFRSVEDSEAFSIDPEITCLVGKNEAGKSAILLAMAALNPHPATPVTLDKERDYPRVHLNNYKRRHGDDEAVVISTTWRLGETELQAIASQFGAEALVGDTVTISRTYAGDPSWTISVNFQAVFEHLFGVFKLDAAERAPLRTAGTSSELITALKGVGTPTLKHQALLQQVEQWGTVTEAIRKTLAARFPRFMYFSNYDRMEGAIQIEQTLSLIQNGQIIDERLRGQKLFAEFLEYAGVPLSEIVSVTTYETFNSRLQGASNNITDQVLEYWTQNPDLEVRVTVESARPGDIPPLNIGNIARAHQQPPAPGGDTLLRAQRRVRVVLLLLGQVRSGKRRGSAGRASAGRARTDAARQSASRPTPLLRRKTRPSSPNYLLHPFAFHGRP